MDKKLIYMKEALLEAQKAYDKNEVPVGAVVVLNDQIIARAHNNRETSQSISGHAEFIALKKASEMIGSWRLEECEVYVTLEPCPMCAGAMIQSRIKALYYGTNDLKSGAVNSIIKMLDLPFNHKVYWESGILADESKDLLQSFFKELRKKK